MSNQRNQCANCFRTLVADEIGLYKRLICRSAEKGFICKTCLAKHFRCDETILDKKIQQYREAGCTLFP